MEEKVILLKITRRDKKWFTNKFYYGLYKLFGYYSEDRITKNEFIEINTKLQGIDKETESNELEDIE